MQNNMDQNALDYFYEDEEPDFYQRLGAFKTSNPPSNRFQRRFIHISKEKSDFKKSVELVLCVHGWKTPEKKEPMTLIILSVRLSCHKRNSRYRSVTITLSFREDNEPGSSKAALEASPEVAAYAPFVEEKRWNKTMSSNQDGNSYGAGLSGGQFVTANVNANRQANISYTRQYFDRGTADRLYDDHKDRLYGVQWYCEQNQLAKTGVEPHFHLAILVDRKHDANNEPIPFSAILDMKLEAGFAHDFGSGIRRIFRLKKPADAPIFFDPSKQPQVCGLDGVGENILQNIQVDNLGALAKKQKLTSLVEIPFPGLEPLLPPC
ncbi:hypothetical protein TRIATDRAFT_287499 [Trichoderma atroviride IMI 206040]|uniref:Uncharacterized protein n=1 Tax=Hypocrea atroviridis (strain ATCC 20476 / IMI 206040) TaxID=452589 RepID=G9P5G8_HYPAI|nr:uncharacterized protein TRIATDRAFT_287499 [Trichoderma atroviride IMI 206040]EHK42139.1 hypothetical protein TRIATDRAFT_287499 [Trichoderma atroviride IMI 206040]